MWQEPPPKPPQETVKTLVELANYYRQLIIYHQKAAAAAASQLSYLEALLQTSGDSWWQELPTTFNSGREMVAELEEVKESLPKFLTEKDVMPLLREILTANKGTILRLDYLVREIYGSFFSSQQQQDLKVQLKEKLILGERQGMWASVPDSPDCWTLDLSDFPDIASNSPKKNQLSEDRPIPYNLSRMPYSAKLEKYETITATILQCLRKHHPRTMDAHQVMDWIYPQGVEEQERRKTYYSISNCLIKGCDTKGWHRVAKAKYIWDGKTK